MSSPEIKDISSEFDKTECECCVHYENLGKSEISNDFRVEKFLLESNENCETKLKNAFIYSLNFMKYNNHFELFNTKFTNTTSETKELITNSIEQTDHVGFLIPPKTDINLLKQVAIESGFKSNHRVFNSVIVARELGQLIGKDSVETTIFLCSGMFNCSIYSIEIFIPNEDEEIVNKWICEGRVKHIALRARNIEAVNEIIITMKNDGYLMPEFMNGEGMFNKQQGSLTAYFDLVEDGERMRFEILYTPQIDLSQFTDFDGFSENCKIDYSISKENKENDLCLINNSNQIYKNTEENDGKI